MKTIGIISANYISGQFGDLTRNRTLASLPYGGRYRLIDFALSNMTNSGITTVGVISPFNSGSLIDHIGDGSPWSLDRKIGGLIMLPGSVFGQKSSGRRFVLRDILENKEFLERDDADYVILSGSSDVYNLNYSELIEQHSKSSAPITLLCKHVDNAENYRGFFIEKDEQGNVENILVESKGEADYFMDCCIMDRKYLLDLIQWYASLEHMDLFDIIRENPRIIDIDTYEFKGYYGKINDIVDYMNVSRDLFDYETRKELFMSDDMIYTKIQDEAPALFKPTAEVKNSLIATGCKIEGRVENSIIFRSTHIGKNTVVSNSVIMQHCDIKDGALLHGVVLDKYVEIGENVKLAGGTDGPIIIGKGSKL